MSENKILSPKLDVVFQALFGEVGSEKITKRFLQNILNEKIESIDLSQNPILRREKQSDKLGILDVIAKINEEENCNIEMQIINEDNIIERILYYWSKLYTRDLKSGEDYSLLKRTIVVLIADFELSTLKELNYHTTWKIIEEKDRKIILTTKLEIHILELPKVKRESNGQEELIDWLTFLENPKSERVQRKMKENEELEEAQKKLETMSEDEYMQRIADLREKAILDEKARLSYAIKQGIEQGIEQGVKQGIEQGVKQGIEQGVEQGIEQGLKRGRKEGKKEIAKKMLQEGISIEVIMKITGLTKDEILD